MSKIILQISPNYVPLQAGKFVIKNNGYKQITRIYFCTSCLNMISVSNNDLI